MSELRQRLLQLETELHQPAVRLNRSRLEEILHPKFKEFGRSGKVYSRSEIVKELSLASDSPQIESSNFEATEIAEGVVLLTYLSEQRDASGEPRRHTLRSSLWKLSPTGWRMHFHQGTPTTLS